MKTASTELKKLKRSGLFAVLPTVGLLGAGYAFVFFAIRRDSLLSLPLAPTDMLLTQLYGMTALLNMFGLVLSGSIAYGVEYKAGAIKKLQMLPVGMARIYLSKLIILTALLFAAVIAESAALALIGIKELPQGELEFGRLAVFGAYSFLCALPVLSFMLLVCSQNENMWLPLGVGVAGFLSAMALAPAKNGLTLLHPFVIMLRPAVVLSARPEACTAYAALAETALLVTVGLLSARRVKEG